MVMYLSPVRENRAVFLRNFTKQNISTMKVNFYVSLWKFEFSVALDFSKRK